MLTSAMQSDTYTTQYSYNTESTEALLIQLGIYLVMWLFFSIVLWRVFTKAGKPGWHALVPILNNYTMIKIARRPGWWLLLMFIPCVSIVISCIVFWEIGKSFNKSTGFCVGLILLTPIFLPILAFGRSRYWRDDDAPRFGHAAFAGAGGYTGGTTGYGNAGYGNGGHATTGYAPQVAPQAPTPQPPGASGYGIAASAPLPPLLTPAAQPAPAEPVVEPTPTQPPPGWYPDPAGQSALRYWDGVAWTDHVQ